MKKSLAAYGICLLIVGVGFCGFCVMSVAKDHLLVSRDLLYEKSAFTEGFAEVYEAPAAIKDKLADIPGIGEVQARIIKEARLTDIGDGNARLKLISYEKGGRNVPMLFRGTDVKAGELQVVAGNAFFGSQKSGCGNEDPCAGIRKGYGARDYRWGHFAGKYLHYQKYRGYVS